MKVIPDAKMEIRSNTETPGRVPSFSQAQALKSAWDSSGKQKVPSLFPAAYAMWNHEADRFSLSC